MDCLCLRVTLTVLSRYKTVVSSTRFFVAVGQHSYVPFDRVENVLQCVWWGHPVTAGTGAIDYFLSLDAELDEGQADYLEQMIRMDLINTAPFRQVS